MTCFLEYTGSLSLHRRKSRAYYTRRSWMNEEEVGKREAMSGEPSSNSTLL